jgi:hypothetical protein
MLMSLRDALHQNIHESGVPIKRLADDIGISYSYLANAGNPNLEDFHFQLRHLVPLMKATGNLAVLDYLEHSMGRVAFCIPESSEKHLSVTSELISIITHVGELAGKIQSAIEDNIIEKREARDIEPLLFELSKHAMQMMKSLTEAAK